MGQDIDRPITAWDDMFLPSEIARRITEFSYAGPDGKEKPLVSSVEIVNKSKGRPPVMETPKNQWPRALLLSSFFSALLLLFFMLFKKKKGFGVFIGMVNASLGLFFGAAGSILFFMTFFTNHDYTFHNSNVLFVNPLFLAAIPLGIIFAFTKNDKRRVIAAAFLRAFWIYILLGGILTIVIKLSPQFYQQNQVTQALLLPVSFIMLFLSTRLPLTRKIVSGR
jgi:hypothetical protein